MPNLVSFSEMQMMMNLSLYSPSNINILKSTKFLHAAPKNLLYISPYNKQNISNKYSYCARVHLYNNDNNNKTYFYY